MRFFYIGGEIVKQEKLNGKIQLVDEIKEKIQSAQSIVLVDYRGLTVEEVTELRKKYREANVEYKVYKNTMMKRAFDEVGQTDIAEYLNGPSAVAFSLEDPVSAAKVTADFAKTHDVLEIKAGIVDGKLISKEEVIGLSQLPSKEVLVAKLLGSMNSPIQGLVNVLNGNIKGLAVVLNAIAEKKEKETA